MSPSELKPELTPELAALIEGLIERQVKERVDAALTARLGPLQAALDEISGRVAASAGAGQGVSLLVFSGELDRLLAGFIVATSAAAMGLEVSMYFTFWGLVALKKQTIYAGKSVAERLLAACTPATPGLAGLSTLNMLGAGPALLRSVMKARGVESLPGLIAAARELGVRMIACQMAMDVMGIVPAELIDGVEFAGAATYVDTAVSSRVTLFI